MFFFLLFFLFISHQTLITLALLSLFPSFCLRLPLFLFFLSLSPSVPLFLLSMSFPPPFLFLLFSCFHSLSSSHPSFFLSLPPSLSSLLLFNGQDVPKVPKNSHSIIKCYDGPLIENYAAYAECATTYGIFYVALV